MKRVKKSEEFITVAFAILNEQVICKLFYVLVNIKEFQS